MKVTSIRFDPKILEKLEGISASSNVDLTTIIRHVVFVGLDISGKVSRVPLEKVPQEWRTPELLFLSEVIRQRDKS
jgi:hypothetical protein